MINLFKWLKYLDRKIRIIWSQSKHGLWFLMGKNGKLKEEMEIILN